MIFCTQKNFILLSQIRENSLDNHDFFFKSIITVMIKHCGYQIKPSSATDYKPPRLQTVQRKKNTVMTAGTQNASSLKGKAVLLPAWSGPEVSRKLRFPDFTTTAQDGGKVVSRTHQPPLPLGNTPGTHFC
jgi:hypothetical protein